MTGSRLLKLPLPQKRYDPARKTKKASAGDRGDKWQLESEAACAAEDIKRAQLLCRSARSMDDPKIKAEAMALAEILGEGADSNRCSSTLASSLYWRELRRNIIGNLLAFIDRHVTGDLYLFTIISPHWEIPGGKLLSTELKQIVKSLENDLRRVRGSNESHFIFAVIHGQYDPIRNVYSIHFHGIACEAAIESVRSLRTLKCYKKSDFIAKPIVTEKIYDLPRVLSYCLQTYWDQKNYMCSDTGEVRRRSLKSRITGLSHSLYLLKMHDSELSDLILMCGFTAMSAGFSPSRIRSKS